MGQITKAFAEKLLEDSNNLKYTGLTCHEKAQLATAWLQLHGHNSGSWVDEELKDGDRICEAAGVQRTEGGRLPVAKIINLLARSETKDRTPESAPTGASGAERVGDDPVSDPTTSALSASASGASRTDALLAENHYGWGDVDSARKGHIDAIALARQLEGELQRMGELYQRCTELRDEEQAARSSSAPTEEELMDVACRIRAECAHFAWGDVETERCVELIRLFVSARSASVPRVEFDTFGGTICSKCGNEAHDGACATTDRRAEPK